VASRDLDSQSFDPIEMAAKIVALMAALLPLGGVLARSTAFAIGYGVDWALPLAWSAPLPELAVTGLYCLILVLPIPGILWLDWRLATISDASTTELPTSGRQRKSLLLIALGLALILAGWLILPWPVPILSLLLALPLFYGPRLAWRGKRKKRFRDIWWVVVLLVLIADVIGGAVGTLPGVVRASYEFDPSATRSLTNGSYQQLGVADGFLYLQKCGSRQVYVVDERAVVLQTAETGSSILLLGAPAPNFVQVLLGATPQVGVPPC
jgi:hypothetical protein